MVTHGGNLYALAATAGCVPAEILDFSASLNPLGPPPSVVAAIHRHSLSIDSYPEPTNASLQRALASLYGCTPEQIVPGRGATELLFAIPRCFPVRRAMIWGPCYGDYPLACERAGLKVVWNLSTAMNQFSFPARAISQAVEPGDMLFIGRPNNPTGIVPKGDEVLSLCHAKPETLFVIDESFIEFSAEPSICANIIPPNCIVVRSLTKFYGIPGIRLGAAIASVLNAKRLRSMILPWSIDAIGQRIGECLLNESDYTTQTRKLIAEERTILSTTLDRLPGITTFPSDANFILAQACPKIDLRSLVSNCLKNHRIAVRNCDDYYGLNKGFFRVAVRSRQENDRLCAAIREELGTNARVPVSRKIKKTAKTLMLQGTSSNSGKTIITAAICRILHRRGVSVAPFKAQNMSLNSFVTHQGHEMGRAQALQAIACRTQPDVRMNPVLLKPNSDTGCQVIVNGTAQGNMKVQEYLRYKQEAFQSVKKAFDELSTAYDAIILEGAGSPAEINLKRHDIVNMGMARYASSPVLIVGDIDRGGVFASFIGTYAVLDKEERALTKGFIINRFRGDASLLESAIQTTFDFTGIPTLAVVPFLPNLGLPEEDAVSFKEKNRCKDVDNTKIDIVLIDFPHISNFTDFDPLEGEPDTVLRIVAAPEQLGTPDAIILPGSKNTGKDLQYLKTSGLADAIVDMAARGNLEIVGICGGYQMIGESLIDNAVECSTPVLHQGLGLLPIRTQMNANKVLTNVSGVHIASGYRVRGYEIHHGRTSDFGGHAVIEMSDGRAAGTKTSDGRIWGTYLHGLFDEDQFRRWWIDSLRRRKGLVSLGTVQFSYDVDIALDRLADEVEHALDMKTIYQIMGL